MAMQIVTGIKNGTEVLIGENQSQVNYTEALKEIFNTYFEEMNFTEDGEEIIYSAIDSKSFLEIGRLICEKQEIVINEIKKVHGNGKRNDFVNRLHDYILIMSVIVEAISLSQNNREVVLLLV